MTQYSDCHFCGGEVKEQRISREVWWKGHLHIFENVPVGVCTQCGEKVVKPNTAKHLDKLLAMKAQPRKTLPVPVYEFPQETA